MLMSLMQCKFMIIHIYLFIYNLFIYIIFIYLFVGSVVIIVSLAAIHLYYLLVLCLCFNG